MLLPILIKLSIYCFKTNLLKVRIFIGFSIEVTKNLWQASHNKKNIVISLSSQILFGLGFWICLYSIGLNLNIFLILVLVPGIFLFASFPVAIAGFGPREAGSLIFLMRFIPTPIIFYVYLARLRPITARSVENRCPEN